MSDELTPLEVVLAQQREMYVAYRSIGFTRLEAILMIGAQITIGSALNEKNDE